MREFHGGCGSEMFDLNSIDPTEICSLRKRILQSKPRTLAIPPESLFVASCTHIHRASRNVTEPVSRNGKSPRDRGGSLDESNQSVNTSIRLPLAVCVIAVNSRRMDGFGSAERWKCVEPIKWKRKTQFTKCKPRLGHTRMNSTAFSVALNGRGNHSRCIISRPLFAAWICVRVAFPLFSFHRMECHDALRLG